MDLRHNPLNMKLIQNHYINLGKKEFELTETEVVIQYKFLSYQRDDRFSYSELDSRTINARAANSAYQNVAALLFGLLIASALYRVELQYLAVILSGIIISLAMYYSLKERFIGFRTKTNNRSFYIRLSKSGKEKPFVEALKNKLSD